MQHNLDDLKREILSRVPEKDHYTAHWIIDYLHDQGRILPDGHVAVPLEPTKEIITFMKRAESGEYTFRQAWAELIAAAQKVGG